MDRFPGFPKKPAFESNFWAYPKVLSEWWHVLQPAEQKVLDYILRHTWGFNKTFDQISYTQFIKGVANCDKGCGITGSDTLSNALKGLETKGFIRREGGQKTGKPIEYHLTFCVDEIPLGIPKTTSLKTQDPTSWEIKDTIDNKTIDNTNISNINTSINITAKNVKQISTDKKKRIFVIYFYWNNRVWYENNSKQTLAQTKMTGRLMKDIEAGLKDYTVDEIKQAIDNYVTVKSNKTKYAYHYDWDLGGFIYKGIVKFINIKSVDANYSKNNYGGNTKFVHPNAAPKGKYEGLSRK
jgi:hypothetical protein